MIKLLGIAALVVAAGHGQVHAQGFEGDVALSFGSAPFLNTDDDDERLKERGYKLSGWAGTRFGDWRVFGDVNVYNRDIGTEDFDSYAPEGAKSMGLHAGRYFGPAYVGAFIGQNRFQGDDAAVFGDYVKGNLWGVEAEYSMGSFDVFAQLGRAKMVGDNGDSAFIGNFQRVGITGTFDKMTLTADFERGKSPNIFEDNSDWGKYRAFGVSVDYKISDRLIASLGYEKMDIEANTEDSGYDELYSVGIRIPFGASAGKRNNLTTTYRPGLAAAWAEALD